MWNDIDMQVMLLEIFEDEGEAFRWLFTPLEHFSNMTPIELLAIGEKDTVMDILRKILWGVY